MIVWIVLLVVCVLSASKFADWFFPRFEHFLVRKDWKIFRTREPRIAENVTAVTFLLMSMSLPAISPLFVEFPRLLGRPSIATFNDAGDPVYHKWGLWTPPWKWRTQEVANVPGVGTCSPVEDVEIFTSMSSFTVMWPYDDTIYQVVVDAETCFRDPRKFYSVKEMRKQGLEYNRTVARMERDVSYDLLSYVAQHTESLKADVIKKCQPPTNEDGYEVGCDYPALILKDVAKQKAEDLGYSLEVTSKIRQTRFQKKK